MSAVEYGKEATTSTWSTPQLINLVRGRPEEAMLIACKSAPASSGPDNTFNACAYGRGLSGPCGPSASGVSLNAILCFQCDTLTASQAQS